MKKGAALLCVMLVLTGCTGKSHELERVMQTRTKLLSGKSCTFRTAITADYGDKQHCFTLDCEGNRDGAVRFRVEKPDSIRDICGEIDGGDGKLTFDDTALFFPLLADDQLAPVASPWLLLKTLRGGYITAVGKDGDLLRATIDDSYADDALQLDIWLDETDIPVRAEILYRGRKILSMNVEAFRFV